MQVLKQDSQRTPTSGRLLGIEHKHDDTKSPTPHPKQPDCVGKRQLARQLYLADRLIGELHQAIS